MKNLFGVYFTDVLKEMCSRVGVEFEDIDFDKDEWYLDHEWTQDEQEDFIRWFAKFLRNKGVRTEITKYPSLLNNYVKREQFARQFLTEFGWKVKE